MKWIPVVFVLFVSCQNGPWNKDERKEFLQNCIEEGGTSDYCDCFLEKISKTCPSFEELDNITYEERVEISSDCQQ